MKKIVVMSFVGISLCGNLRAATTYTYYGPNYDQSQNAIGNGAIDGGKLSFTAATSATVSAVYTRGSSAFDKYLVIFVDTVSGGFTGTGGFTDNNGGFATAVSGFRDSSHRATANFASGFAADYAIVISGDSGGVVYQLVNHGDFTQTRTISSGLGGTMQSTYSFSFDWVDIGLTPGANNSFNFETSYIRNDAFRTLETFESLTGASGYDTVNFTRYDSFPIAPVPEPANSALLAFGALAVVGFIYRMVRYNFSRVGDH
jgi:hypothetical protein